MPYYKAVRLDHTSHYDGRTRWHEGGIVTPLKLPDPEVVGLCGSGIHCSPTILDVVSYQYGPSDYCEVQPLGIIAEDSTKARCSAVQVLRWIPAEEQDLISGFKLYETNHPVNPLWIERDTTLQLDVLLRQWASVRDGVNISVWFSVRDSVKDSVWARALANVGDVVWSSVGDSIWSRVGDSVAGMWASMECSMRDCVWAYIGGLFPAITEWKHVESFGSEPWGSLLNLWYGGYVPSYDGKVWRLHAGPKAEVVYELKG